MTAIPGLKRRQAGHTGQDDSSLEAAQSRFMTAVSDGVEELMRRSGYSRDRATSALLRELGRGDAPPNHEIFDTMMAHGLGVEDAGQVLTVSRAVGRVMNEHGLSAVGAIDHLVSELSITKLLASGVEETEESLPQRPCSPEVRVPATLLSAPSSERHSHMQRKAPGRKSSAKPKNGKPKAVKRKRSSTDETKQGENLKFSSQRARADSVSEVVEAKVAKKARAQAPEDSPSEADMPANPTVLRPKLTPRSTDEKQPSTHGV